MQFTGHDIRRSKDGSVRAVHGSVVSSGVASRDSLPTRNSGVAKFGRSSLGSDVPSELIQSVSESITFAGVEHLSRAIPLSRVMRGFAKIFNGSAGSLETFNLSEQTDHIRCFISHNWSVSQFDKFMAMSMFFNFPLAVAFTVCITIALGILSGCGYVPLMYDPIENPPQVGFLSRTLTLPVCLFMLLFGNDFLAFFGWKGPLMFLDKACIHQVDFDLKMLGIKKLGAFLRVSERMLMLYTDVYLQKLWTILEVANFLTMHSIDRLDVVPVFVPRILFAALPVHYVYHLLCMVIRYQYGVSEVRYILYILGSWLYISILRRWARHKQQIQERLKTFQVRNCICAVESDRAVVYDKIADLMRVSKCVERSASLEEALTAFDQEVRDKMPAAFRMLLGSTTLSYGQYVFLAFTVVAPSTADFSTRWQYEDQTVEVINEDLVELLLIIVIWPASFYVTEVLAGKWLHWTGLWQCWIYLAIDLIVGIPACGLYVILTIIASRPGSSSTLILIGTCVLLAGSTFFAVWLNRRRIARSMAPARSSDHIHAMETALSSALSMKSMSTKLSFEDPDSTLSPPRWKSDETSGELDVTRCFV